MTLHFADTPEKIAHCWEAMYALRPHLHEDRFVQTVLEMRESDQYEMIYIDIDGKAVAVLGFRYMRTLYQGKTIYIDDLSTLPEARGRGCGSALLDFIHEKARQEGLDAVVLDSGHARFDAHRLYLNKGYRITTHHFVKEIGR